MTTDLIFVCSMLINFNPCASFDLRKTLMNPFKRGKIDKLGDLKKCRVTHSGVEYEGNIAQTKSGILCQNWETPEPIHHVAEQLIDADFPEGSKKKAKNYCRNPQHWSGRPWCYTLDYNITEEECDIPLCTKVHCRLTGIGVEYSGLAHTSGTMDCLFWSDIRGVEYKDILYDSLFPDGTKKKAENRCRNPDSDVGGPWCFVEAELKNQNVMKNYDKAYCGIPLCEPRPCMTATAAVSSGYQDYHTLFSQLPPNTTSINFAVKMWNPEQWQRGELKLALAVFPVPATGSEMRLWHTGIEIVISTYKSGLTPADAEKPDWNIEPGLLSGIKWQDLELSWTGGFISLKVKGKATSIFTKDFTDHEKDLSREQFQFYSIKGSNVVWDFSFCSSDYAYEEHITTHGDFERRWPLPKRTAGLELKFFVRGFHTAIVELKSAAMLQYPSIQLTLVSLTNRNLTTLTIKESLDQDRSTLAEVKIESLLTYWEWREFSLNIDGPRLELYWNKDSRLVKLLSATNSIIKSLKWYSFGSRQSTVHWSFNCKPPKEKLKIRAELPECVMNEGEAEFSGIQSVSSTGLTCVPWNDPTGTVPKDIDDSAFVDGSKELAKNYCRNPTDSPKGPFCYAIDLTDSGYVVSKQYCYPRQCRSKECKMAGTGIDYIGSLSVTISGRTCQRWTAKTPHSIPQELLSREMYPELSSNISNFCRNPSHETAGLWCYTSDPAIDTDICNVPDCDVLGACIIIVKGNDTRQNIYILPLWRTNGLAFKVKSWDPKFTEGVRFIIHLSKNDSQYRLDLGAGKNDKVVLYFTDFEGKEKVLKQKTIARIIPSGHWVGFVITLGFGEVGIKFENVPDPFFYWKYTFTEGMEPLQPRFLSYTALTNRSSVGLNFPCEECHTQITEPGLSENIYPFNWWKPQTQQTKNKVLSLNIRGTGTFILVLMRLIGTLSNRMLIEVSDYGQIVVKDKDSVLAENRSENYKIFNNRSWTSLSLSFTEEKLIVTAENISIIDYLSNKSNIFYFFTISVSNGILIWNANCEAPPIDASPINGGWSKWSPWECSVSCGRGNGKRKRFCDSPKPNLFGEPCNGSDVMEGVCNDFKCGDVPPELFETMTKHITKKAHNIRMRVGESFSISCNQYILTELKDKAPKTKVEWMKDGLPLYTQQRADNISVHEFKVTKTNVGLNDSGVYICALEDSKGQKAVIQIIAVTIVTNISTRFTRKDSTIVLDCQATLLASLFSELTQFWTLNSKLFQDFGATSLSLLDVDLLYPVSQEHEGEWECIVAHVGYNLTWVTAWFRLKVNENSIIAIMFDKMFIGQYFRPFGDNVIANSILGLVLIFALAVFVVILLVTFFFYRKGHNIKIKSPIKMKKDSGLALSEFSNKYKYQRLGQFD